MTEPTTPTEALAAREKLIREHTLTLHVVGEQLSQIESWFWAHLADVREAARKELDAPLSDDVTATADPPPVHGCIPDVRAPAEHCVHEAAATEATEPPKCDCTMRSDHTLKCASGLSTGVRRVNRLGELIDDQPALPILIARAEQAEAARDRYARLAEERADHITRLTADRDGLRIRLAEQEAETMRQHEHAQRAEAAIARVRAVACDPDTYEDPADVIRNVRAALDGPQRADTTPPAANEKSAPRRPCRYCPDPLCPEDCPECGAPIHDLDAVPAQPAPDTGHGICTATIDGNTQGRIFRCAQAAGHYDEDRQPDPLVDDHPGGWHQSAPDREGHHMTWSDRAAGATPHRPEPADITDTAITDQPPAHGCTIGGQPAMPILISEHTELVTRAERAEAELRRYTEAESADAAAGSYAGRAEQAEQRLRLAHQARRAKEHQLDGIRRALCDAGFMRDDDPYSHADLEDVIRQAGQLDEVKAAVSADIDDEDEYTGPVVPATLTDAIRQNEADRQEHAAAVEAAATEWRAEDHVGHGSPCEHQPDGSCAGPADTCQPVEVDGETISVRDAGDFSDTGPVPEESPQAAVAELAQAIRLTREYVGEELLPAVEGWDWYDALRKWAPHELPEPESGSSTSPELGDPGFKETAETLNTGPAVPGAEPDTVTDPAWLSTQYAKALDDETEDAYLTTHIVNTVMRVRDRHVEQLRQRLTLAEQVHQDIATVRERADRYAATLDRVRSAVHIADAGDATDWQRGYRACADRVVAELDSKQAQAWTPPPPGDTREQLPEKILDLIRPYLRGYTSTACQTAVYLTQAATDHPEHATELDEWRRRMGERCRRNQKYTGEICPHHPTKEN